MAGRQAKKAIPAPTKVINSVSGFQRPTIRPTMTVIGLLSFSKILNRLLTTYQSLTMSLLCGFMVGSLRKIWPFARDLNPNVTEFKRKAFANVIPDFTDSSVWLSIVFCGLAAGFVFALNHFSNGRERA